jgi:hypothetical protein
LPEQKPSKHKKIKIPRHWDSTDEREGGGEATTTVTLLLHYVHLHGNANCGHLFSIRDIGEPKVLRKRPKKRHTQNTVLIRCCKKATTLYREIDAMLSSVKLPPLSILSLSRARILQLSLERLVSVRAKFYPPPGARSLPNLTLTSDLTSEPDPNLPLDLLAYLPIPTSEPGRSPSEPTDGRELAYIQTYSLLPNLLLVRFRSWIRTWYESGSKPFSEPDQFFEPGPVIY